MSRILKVGTQFSQGYRVLNTIAHNVPGSAGFRGGFQGIESFIQFCNLFRSEV